VISTCSQNWETPEGQALQLWWRGEFCSEKMVSETKYQFFKGRISKTSAALAEVYWSAWWLCIKII
jgi:hypothetical protein